MSACCDGCKSGVHLFDCPERIQQLEEWKGSAMQALSEWHHARELIGGAQLGDGPVEWARRVAERLEKAERERDEWRKTSYSLHPLNAAEYQRALEDAAKVLEGLRGKYPNVDLLAAAIRALATNTTPVSTDTPGKDGGT